MLNFTENVKTVILVARHSPVVLHGDSMLAHITRSYAQLNCHGRTSICETHA